MKTAIVCEGGGMRGVFTAGVLQSFMDGDFVADMLVGVSAGASNGASYVSRQKLRGYRTNVNYSHDRRYAGLYSFLTTGSFFGMDFIFGEIPNTLDPFDFETFYESPTAYYAGATDVYTGKPVFFDKNHVTPGFTAIRSSCSIPVFSPIVEYQGGKYLDGGVSAPIPLQQALDLSAERLVVVLTQPRGFEKKPMSMRRVYKQVLHKYPAMVHALDRRHQVYNETLRQVDQLEAQGQVVVIAPPQALGVDRFGKDREKLIDSYRIGERCGKEALAAIQSFL